jgi:putative spermidine/putrescine transport system permease protein
MSSSRRAALPSAGPPRSLQDPDFQASLWFSTTLALGATGGALLLGVPAAFAVARHEFPGRGAAAAALLSPLVFPALITGVALLQLFATHV